MTHTYHVDYLNHLSKGIELTRQQCRAFDSNYDAWLEVLTAAIVAQSELRRRVAAAVAPWFEVTQ